MPAAADEFVVDGVAYRCRRLSAARQWEIWRRLAPVAPRLIRAEIGLHASGLAAKALTALLAPLCDVADDAMDAVFADVRSAVERVDGEPVGEVDFSSLALFLGPVDRFNFAPFRDMPRPSFDPCPPRDGDKGFGSLGPVDMPNGESWLYAPMVAGFCDYAEIHDGTLQIADVQRMNDLLAVKGENEARLQIAAERG